jgi:hypothetical protein
MTKLNLTLTESKELLTLMKTSHNTLSKSKYFDVSRLSESIQHKIASLPVEVENSSYTSYNSMAFVRFEVIGHEFEIGLGECDVRYSDYKYDSELDAHVTEEGEEIDPDSYAEEFADQLWSTCDVEYLTLYFQAA